MGDALMTHVSLFTGIGGLDLAAEAAGFETVLQVEREPYALRILERHWPNVPRITDVREVHEDGRWTKPTVVSGGFPCQPFSAAGKRRGSDDDRYLWPELLRISNAIGARWIVGENVPGLLSIDNGREIDSMLNQLDVSGYEPWVLDYEAALFGAIHRRRRIFIVAKRRGDRRQGHKQPERTCETRQRRQGGAENMQSLIESPYDSNAGWPKPLLRRGHDDVPHWVDRLKALGNSVVPAQAYPIFYAIAQAEGEINA